MDQLPEVARCFRVIRMMQLVNPWGGLSAVVVVKRKRAGGMMKLSKQLN